MLDDGGEVLKSIQSKMDATGIDNFDEWLSYVNVYDNANDLFILRFERDPSNDNVFNFYLSVNRESVAYQNKGVENIYGTYKIVFYANELENGEYSTEVITTELGYHVILKTATGEKASYDDSVDSMRDAIAQDKLNEDQSLVVDAIRYYRELYELDIVDSEMDSQYGVYMNNLINTYENANNTTN